MSEKINWHKHEGDSIGWAIINLMAELEERTGRAIALEPGFDAEKIEVRCQINGIEVSFTDLVTEMTKQFDRIVNEAAADLISKKMSKLKDTLDDAEREVRSVLNLPND